MVSGKRAKAHRRQARVDRDEAIKVAATAPATVMVRCPRTGNFFPSPIRVKPADFETIKLTNLSSHCPFCDQYHSFDDTEVVLDN